MYSYCQRCSLWHPKKCRYYIEYSNCKFGIYCRFSHDLIPIKKHKEEIDKVKKQIEALNQDITEKENELKKRDEEINLMEMRIILKKDKIIQLKEAEITNLAKDNLEMKNKVEEIEKEN